MIKMDLNPDNPHSPARTLHTADVVAECTRVLAYATSQGQGLGTPSDLYAVMGDVRDGASHLATMVRNASCWLDGQHSAGRVGIDAPADAGMVDAHMSVTRAALLNLETAAAAFREAANTAQSALWHITSVEPSRG